MHGCKPKPRKADSNLIEPPEAWPRPRRCEHCKWWVLCDDCHECRRHSPTASVNLHSAIIVAWPTTDKDDFCGDFEQKENQNGES